MFLSTRAWQKKKKEREKGEEENMHILFVTQESGMIS